MTPDTTAVDNLENTPLDIVGALEEFLAQQTSSKIIGDLDSLPPSLLVNSKQTASPLHLIYITSSDEKASAELSKEIENLPPWGYLWIYSKAPCELLKQELAATNSLSPWWKSSSPENSAHQLQQIYRKWTDPSVKKIEWSLNGTTDDQLAVPDFRHRAVDKPEGSKWIGLRLMLLFDIFCQQQQLDYTLAFGTLLGAVRHRGFIPWDDDVDLQMTTSEYAKFEKVKENLPPSMRFTPHAHDHYKLVDPYSSGYSGEDGISIDIFVIHQKSLFNSLESNLSSSTSTKRPLASLLQSLVRLLPQKIRKTGSQYLSSRRSKAALNTSAGSANYSFVHPYGTHIELNAAELAGTRDYCFEGFYFPLASNAISYLTQCYGENYHQPPPLEKRVAPHCDWDELSLGEYGTLS